MTAHYPHMSNHFTYICHLNSSTDMAQTKTPIQPTVELANGNKVIDFTPNNTRQSAIVDLSVLLQLVSYLPVASFARIREEMMARIDNANNITEYVNVLAAELAFHQSVNLIQDYTPEPVAGDYVKEPEYPQ